MTIWKFPLVITDEQTVRMPSGAEILNAALDPQGELCLWAMVHPRNPLVDVPVRIVGTGHATTSLRGDYVNSVVQGEYVWHVFARNTQ